MNNSEEIGRNHPPVLRSGAGGLLTCAAADGISGNFYGTMLPSEQATIQAWPGSAALSQVA
jgi:hypothetical protein